MVEKLKAREAGHILRHARDPYNLIFRIVAGLANRRIAGHPLATAWSLDCLMGYAPRQLLRTNSNTIKWLYEDIHAELPHTGSSQVGESR